MTFRADGTSVVRDTEQGVAGVAIAFDPNMASRIAEALNGSQGGGFGRRVTDPLTGEQVDRLDIQDARRLSEVVRGGRYVKIVGPYATALMDTPGGRQVRSLAEGSIVPGDVTAGHARHLIDVGLAQLVEASSAQDAYEGAPTERHRVEMADPNVIGPTVGQPTPGSPAAQYDRDPIAAARAAASGAGARPVVQTTGAGEAHGATAETPARSGRPSVNEPKGAWVEYHVAERPEHVDEVAAREQAEAWTKDDLKQKAGREYPAAGDGQQD